MTNTATEPKQLLLTPCSDSWAALAHPSRGTSMPARPASNSPDSRPGRFASVVTDTTRPVLDRQARSLFVGRRRVNLTPRAFSLLTYLVDRPGETVARADLLRAVWPGVVVEEGQVKQFVCALRAALGDPPTKPRLIETVRGVGYRYLGGILIQRPPRRSEPLPPAATETERPVRRGLEAMLHGRRFLKVSDAPLPWVDDTWLATHAEAGGALESGWTLHLCCSAIVRDEPCAPLLDALDALATGTDGPVAVHALARWAPTWARELPWRYTRSEVREIQSRSAPGQPGRLRREMARLLEALSAHRPLVLRVDNLHEADPELQRLMAYLVLQKQPARLLLLLTGAPCDTDPVALVVRTATRYDTYEVLGIS